MTKLRIHAQAMVVGEIDLDELVLKDIAEIFQEDMPPILEQRIIDKFQKDVYPALKQYVTTEPTWGHLGENALGTYAPDEVVMGALDYMDQYIQNMASVYRYRLGHRNF